MIVTIANVSMPVPGVVHHDYVDAPLSPQSEAEMATEIPQNTFSEKKHKSILRMGDK